MTNKETIDVINRSHDDIRSLLEMHQMLTTAEIGAIADLMKIQFREVIKRQDQTNGNVSLHSSDIKAIKEDMKPGLWISKHWKTVFFICFLILYLTYAMFDIYSLTEIIKFLK